MQRTNMQFLREWLRSDRRKPLLLRGARQVGKTWIVRHLAEFEKMRLVELNFERDPSLAGLFEPNDPHEIMRRIGQRFSLALELKTTLLFLDEIQAKPELISKLRWFYEDMPELAVIAAGSLLEFTLGVEALEIPVGRVSFAYLEPLSFIEFLQAQGKDQLVDLIKTFTWSDEIPLVIHEMLISLMKEYIIVGGLPAAVIEWTETKSLERVQGVHRDLLGSYRADFSKYGGRISPEILNDVLGTIPRLLGKKLMYSHVDAQATGVQIKAAFSLLTRARVVHEVRCTGANGVPLGAEVKHAYRKAIFIDVGLCSTLLDLTLTELDDLNESDLVNKGGIAEQVVGQLLRTIEPCFIEPTLYYWIRTEKGSDAEVDYVIQHRAQVIPVEVKAGSSGSLRSLHFFMQQKKRTKAVRFSSGLPQITQVRVKDAQKQEIVYQLRSIPMYLLSELHRLLD
jgi:hypothetical protein